MQGLDKLCLRAAREQDAAGVLAIYAPVVEQTVISFELDVPSAEEMAQRISKARALAPWIVAEDSAGLAGYAYAGSWRARPAYRYTCEVTVYVAERARRQGVARSLYSELFRGLRWQGFRTAVAGITLPNTPSVRLHESLGFAAAGRFARCGWKFGAWHDVGFWTMELGSFEGPPAALRALDEVERAMGWVR